MALIELIESLAARIRDGHTDNVGIGFFMLMMFGVFPLLGLTAICLTVYHVMKLR